jgi:addiction module HigA family antidote
MSDTMAKRGLPRVHPGVLLADDLGELGLSANAFADEIGVPANRIYQIIKKQRAITADTALRLATFFGTSAEFWMNLQTNYDLWVAERSQGRAIRKRVRPLKRAA